MRPRAEINGRRGAPSRHPTSTRWRRCSASRTSPLLWKVRSTMVSFDRSTVASRRRAFRALHDGPAILVLPNAWDVISARVYEDAGFPAVATSSAGLANSLGYADGNVLDVDLHLATLERLTRALDVPLSAGVESGYAADTASLAAFVTRIAAAGVAGYNLADVADERERAKAGEGW